MPKLTKVLRGWEKDPKWNIEIDKQNMIISNDQVWDLIATLTQWRESHIDMKIGDNIEVPKGEQHDQTS